MSRVRIPSLAPFLLRSDQLSNRPDNFARTSNQGIEWNEVEACFEREADLKAMLAPFHSASFGALDFFEFAHYKSVAGFVAGECLNQMPWLQCALSQ